jgi:pimeloyl-ACP methyl ester carboxylesterase
MQQAQPIGDGSPESEHPRGREDQPPRGHVIVVGGIGGLDWCGIALRHLLKKKRIPFAVDLVPWGLGFGRWYADLTNVDNRDRHARAIAEDIRQYKAGLPDCPVFLVAKSGGSGVAVKALELLDEQAVERVILLAPAVSPDYDLTAALRAVRREIVVFWSPLDVIVLGAGTRVLGTIDRVRTVSAGLVGFRPPALDDGDQTRARLYGKLRQVRWRVRMAASGNFGGHMGPDSPFFLRRYVVPLLTVDETTHS